ncbi:MAG: sulfotransferase [Desulfobacteraceae bacterium]|nr:sulfotransferase [Desulfobacteraceae bacterium]
MKNEFLKSSPGPNGKLKVLFIAGPTRSGSTIISNILSQMKGFFHAGEVIEAWDRGRTWKCSCGQYPKNCEIWSDIFKSLDARISKKDQAEIIRTGNIVSRSHKVILNYYLPSKNGVNCQSEASYLKGLSILYKLIQHKSGADIIIDSSKNVGYADALKKIKAIDLYVVHLVRDSRAAVFSWSKRKKELWRAKPIRKAVEWSSRNLAAEFLKKRRPVKYFQIRYEDFIKNPQKEVLSLLNFMDFSIKQLPFISKDEVIIKSSHGLCGNPGRYNRGVEKLLLDNRWRQMKRSDNLIATVLTWPFLIKYQYPLL